MMSAFAGFFNQKITDEHIANYSVSSPVRELQYSGENYIIVATDETVMVAGCNISICIELSLSVATDIQLAAGELFPIHQLHRVCWSRQVPTVWLVHCREQVFSDISVPE